MKWIKCSDQLPDLNSEVLVYWEDKIFNTYLYDENKLLRERAIKNKAKYLVKLIWDQGCGCCHYSFTEPTHWMLLPEAPEGE